MSTKYLITGGAGFIGSHLTDALLVRQDSVTVLDSLTGGRLGNLDTAGRNPNFRFVHGSVVDELTVHDLMQECEVVVHLASPPEGNAYSKDIIGPLRTVIRGAEVVLAAADRYSRKVVVVSTAELYGESGGAPIPETADQVLRPPHAGTSTLATAKAAEEALAAAFRDGSGLPMIVLRLFSTAGPRQSADCESSINSLVRNALADEPLSMPGAAAERCSVGHVSDVVDAVIRLVDHPNAVGETFNVGAESEATLGDLAERIVSQTGSSSPVRFTEDSERHRCNSALVRIPDYSKLEALTGWRPTVTLDDILNQAISSFRIATDRRS